MSSWTPKTTFEDRDEWVLSVYSKMHPEIDTECTVCGIYDTSPKYVNLTQNKLSAQIHFPPVHLDCIGMENKCWICDEDIARGDLTPVSVDATKRRMHYKCWLSSDGSFPAAVPPSVLAELFNKGE